MCGGEVESWLAAWSAAVLEMVGCVCTDAVCTVIVSPQTVGELSEKHLTVHLVGADVCLLWRQTAAGHQLSEGLTGSRRVKLIPIIYDVDSVSVTVQQEYAENLCVRVLPDRRALPGGFPRCRCGSEFC